jgi:acetyltransferase-like isoleucine patch superfamily enzyme
MCNVRTRHKQGNILTKKGQYIIMTLNDFLAYVATGKPLNTPEICSFMDEMSNEARRVTFRLNAEFHTQEEVRSLLSEIMGYTVPDTLRVFPPFYTDFGKNIHIGENVFINACCHFQDHGGVTLGDGCQIGHNVVFATLNHGLEPENRRFTYPAPIVLGRNVWVGSNATILQGVTIGDNSVVAAGAVVTKDVPADTIVGGVPARVIKHI